MRALSLSSQVSMTCWQGAARTIPQYRRTSAPLGRRAQTRSPGLAPGPMRWQRVDPARPSSDRLREPLRPRPKLPQLNTTGVVNAAAALYLIPAPGSKASPEAITEHSRTSPATLSPWFAEDAFAFLLKAGTPCATPPCPCDKRSAPLDAIDELTPPRRCCCWRRRRLSAGGHHGPGEAGRRRLRPVRPRNPHLRRPLRPLSPPRLRPPLRRCRPRRLRGERGAALLPIR